MHGTILGNCCCSLIHVIEYSVKKPAQSVRIHLKWIAVFWLLYSSCTRLWKISTNLTHLSQRWRIFFAPSVLQISFILAHVRLWLTTFLILHSAPDPFATSKRDSRWQHTTIRQVWPLAWFDSVYFSSIKNRWFAWRANQWSLHGENICAHMLLQATT